VEAKAQRMIDWIQRNAVAICGDGPEPVMYDELVTIMSESITEWVSLFLFTSTEDEGHLLDDMAKRFASTVQSVSASTIQDVFQNVSEHSVSFSLVLSRQVARRIMHRRRKRGRGGAVPGP
jgi:hypothetical protein